MAIPLRLLLIEDSAEDAELLLRLLRKGGYEIESRRVDSAAALADSLEHASWDIAISDYSMPGFSGTAALMMVREKDPDIPFLCISGTIGEEIAVNAMRLGAQDYIMKDHMVRLLPAVRRELRQAALRSEREQIELRVRQLEKFEALGKLAGGITHDFNNVISAIMGWGELGSRDCQPGSPAAESFRQIEQQASRAAGLTRQLLAFARRQVIETSPVGLNQLVGEAAETLQKTIGEQIRMTLSLAPDLCAVRADSAQIERVLINLCLNARDAMPKGGTLAVETRNVSLAEGDPRLPRDASSGRFVVLSVCDTGVGMDPATLEHIFEPFFTTKEAGKGTGLGLATALGIVKQHDGFIDVHSRSKQGAQFHIYLPAAGQETIASPPPLETPVRGGNETILIAEDHEGFLGMASEALRTLGYRVLAAHDGEEAVRIFQENCEYVSLILMDIVMPKLRGTEVYREISKTKPNVPVIFTSGYPDEIAEIASQQAAVLPKPYPPKVLARKVRALLDAAGR